MKVCGGIEPDGVMKAKAFIISRLPDGGVAKHPRLPATRFPLPRKAEPVLASGHDLTSVESCATRERRSRRSIPTGQKTVHGFILVH